MSLYEKLAALIAEQKERQERERIKVVRTIEFLADKLPQFLGSGPRSYFFFRPGDHKSANAPWTGNWDAEHLIINEDVGSYVFGLGIDVSGTKCAYAVRVTNFQSGFEDVSLVGSSKRHRFGPNSELGGFAQELFDEAVAKIQAAVWEPGTKTVVVCGYDPQPDGE